MATRDPMLNYEAVIETLKSRCHFLAEGLEMALSRRAASLNYYLNEDPLREHFNACYLEGMEAILGRLKELRRAYSDAEQLTGIAWLLDRAVADFITALDSALAGLNGVAFDAMRDVMEIEYLLRDFRYDPSGISRWLSGKHERDFMPVRLRERHASKLGVPVRDLPDSQDYKIHSQGLHVSPGFILSDLVGKGFTPAPGGRAIELAFAEAFEHGRRLLFTASLLGRSVVGAAWTVRDPATDLPTAEAAWRRAQTTTAALNDLERGKRSGAHFRDDAN